MGVLTALLAIALVGCAVAIVSLRVALQRERAHLQAAVQQAHTAVERAALAAGIDAAQVLTLLERGETPTLKSLSSLQNTDTRRSGPNS